MKQLGWVLAGVYVGLGVGSIYSLAVDARMTFFLLTGLLAGLAIPQWYLLSRRGSRSSDELTTSDDGS
ncbi:hypothetical protein [Natrarchaeobaculum sulfurireducens]|uniref:Uncharacterized protein n=1 Tax=Natrarchaeobaculum sulfurireducens TaxID=2044521 RepID=A0A346PIB6_9EURY|nr:hypothetical protein [Natrarchaeobaculum sulfurireducens]AXR79261.1 hypothetical protein AArc1_2953 [Natrarchaeobaculum sulfurireducens]